MVLASRVKEKSSKLTVFIVLDPVPLVVQGHSLMRLHSSPAFCASGTGRRRNLITPSHVPRQCKASFKIWNLSKAATLKSGTMCAY